MKTLKYCLLAVAILALSGCDKKNDNLVAPMVDADFPQILLLADEGDGELEEEDKFSFKVTLADRPDPNGTELGGKVIPLTEDVTLNFEISAFKGFSSIASFISGAKAFYEIDDCSTSEDADIDLHLIFDKATGKGSVTFPKGVEEIEIEFETNPNQVDDAVFNTEARTMDIKLTSVQARREKVVVNDANAFEFAVLDDEGIYGTYELDHHDATELNKYIKLFGLISEKVKGLSAADVDKIKLEFQYGEFKAIVVLKETEDVDECGEIETVNKEVELEGEFEELEDNKQEGKVEFVGELGQEDGSEKEFTYKGQFKINGKKLVLTLQGMYEDEETETLSLNLSK